ncbi:MAG: formyltransferase family protein [bacterium]
MHTLIFFGSDQYSAVALSTILENRDTAKLEKVTIVTDQKSGGTEVEKLATKHNLRVSYYPDFDHSLITTETLGLCASFDHLIPKNIIAKFAGRLYNLHPSLLPQYRNVSPVQYALAMGDQVTGITLFRISPGIDDGQIIAQAEEQIQGDDTTLTLTPRLFKKGAQLFLSYEPCNPSNHYKVRNFAIPSAPLIFTHRLTRDSGYLEWSVLSKLLSGKPIKVDESKNELLVLRLTHHNQGTILLDLLRALTPWPGVWSNVPTKKGELRISLESVSPKIMLKLASKPNAIALGDFNKYYLE